MDKSESICHAAGGCAALAQHFLIWMGGLVLLAIGIAMVYALVVAAREGRLLHFLLENDATGVGKPSASRLQMIIWNVVIAFAFLFVLADAVNSHRPAAIKAAIEGLLIPEVLILLGISNGTYWFGKRVGKDANPNAAAARKTNKAVEQIPAAETDGPGALAPDGPMG